MGQLGCTLQWQIQEKKTSENGVSPTMCVCNGCNGYNALLWVEFPVRKTGSILSRVEVALSKPIRHQALEVFFSQVLIGNMLEEKVSLWENLSAGNPTTASDISHERVRLCTAATTLNPLWGEADEIYLSTEQCSAQKTISNLQGWKCPPNCSPSNGHERLTAKVRRSPLTLMLKC